jgi:hypothetical protein
LESENNNKGFNIEKNKIRNNSIMLAPHMQSSQADESHRVLLEKKSKVICVIQILLSLLSIRRGIMLNTIELVCPLILYYGSKRRDSILLYSIFILICFYLIFFDSLSALFTLNILVEIGSPSQIREYYEKKSREAYLYCGFYLL